MSWLHQCMLLEDFKPMTHEPAFHIVKQKGKREAEPFSTKKLHSSVQAACLSVRTPEGEAELIARRVVDAVIGWSTGRAAVTSEDVRRIASRGLELFHPEAAYLYQHHTAIV
jgi:transcriptional regulator NrdR family protein